MRGLITLVVAVVGSLCLLAVLIGMDVGDDNSGETVRASNWAEDVCGTIGAWEGQIEAIADGVRTANAAVRPNDGGSGDSVEGTIFVRTAITRAIQATDLTLQEGLERAGIPDADGGEQASQLLIDWAQDTKEGPAPHGRRSSGSRTARPPQSRRSATRRACSRSRRSRAARPSSRSPTSTPTSSRR